MQYFLIRGRKSTLCICFSLSMSRPGSKATLSVYLGTRNSPTTALILYIHCSGQVQRPYSQKYIDDFTIAKLTAFVGEMDNGNQFRSEEIGQAFYGYGVARAIESSVYYGTSVV